MRNRWKKGFLSAMFLVAGLVASPTMAAAQPWIDFGEVFYVNFSNDTRGGAGATRLHFRAAVRSRAGGSVSIKLAQGREILSYDCRSSQVTMNCSSEPFAADAIDPAQPVTIRAIHVNDTTDAQTVLYDATLPVVRFWDWSGMDTSGRPTHVEQRALRLDSALGVVTVRQILWDRQYQPVTFQNGVVFDWWDASTSMSPVEHSMRCRVNGGEWTLVGRVRRSGGDEQAAKNRVRSADGQVHEGEGESLFYQRYSLTVDDPGFWVGGIPAERVGTGATRTVRAEANGRWTCEIRRREGTENRVSRTFEFEVRNGELVAHPAARHLRQSVGFSIIPVGFSVEALPASFDPAEVRRGFFGMSWPDPAAAPLLGTLPAAIQPSFTAPPGQARGGARQPNARSRGRR